MFWIFVLLVSGNADVLCRLAKCQTEINSLRLPLTLTRASGMDEDGTNESTCKIAPPTPLPAPPHPSCH